MLKRIVVVGCLVAVVAAVAGAEELAVGAVAPAFSLVSAVDGKQVSFAPKDGKLKAVIFTCNQCPYAKAFEDRIVSLGREYGQKGVVFYAIDPNDDRQYAVETMDNMKQRATAKSYPFPYLKDGDSTVAASYGARVTPHVFLVDGSGLVVYRGYVDDSAKPEQRAHTGLGDALDSVLARQPVKVTSTRAFGCSIKWKKQG